MRGCDTLEEPTDSAGEANVDLGDAKLDIAVGAGLGEVNIVDADDLAASRVDDLLIEKIFSDGKERFVGLVGVESALGDIEVDA